MKLRKAVRSIAVLLPLALLSVTERITAVPIQFDLDNGTLRSNALGGQLDDYRSGTFAIGTQILTGSSRTLRLGIDFVDAGTRATQRVRMETLGLGAAQNTPSTFGSISDPVGAHMFGPSTIISNSRTSLDPFTVVTATITPRNVVGTQAGDYTGNTGSVCGHGAGNDCEFGVVLPDLLDGPAPLNFTGFTVDFTFGGFLGNLTLDTYEFRLISPMLTILRDPPPAPEPAIPEPATWLLVTGSLGVLGLWRKRV